MSFGDRVTQIKHQPIGGGMQNEPHLIGERRSTGSAVRRQLAFVQFDQIFTTLLRRLIASSQTPSPGSRKFVML